MNCMADFFFQASMQHVGQLHKHQLNSTLLTTSLVSTIQLSTLLHVITTPVRLSMRKPLTKTYKEIRSYNNNPTLCGQELLNQLENNDRATPPPLQQLLRGSLWLFSAVRFSTFVCHLVYGCSSCTRAYINYFKNNELASEVAGVVVSQGEGGEPFQNFVCGPLQKRSRDLRWLRQRHSSKRTTDSKIKWVLFSRVKTNGFVVYASSRQRFVQECDVTDLIACSLCARYQVTECSVVWIVAG